MRNEKLRTKEDQELYESNILQRETKRALSTLEQNHKERNRQDKIIYALSAIIVVLFVSMMVLIASLIN